MSEDRDLPKLTPRPRRKANLTSQEPPMPGPAPADADVTIANPFEGDAFPAAAPEPAAPRAVPRPKQRSATVRDSEKVQLGVKVTQDLKGRARAAFKEAAYYEDVPTFEQFVSGALEAEIRRIEIEHNGGHPLQPRDENLPRGRAMR